MKPFTVRIYQRWKSIKQPQQDSGLYPIKIQIVSKDENRKQKDIHTNISCTRKVYEALFTDSSTATPHQLRDINKIRKAPENIEIKRKVEELYYRYYDIIKDVTRENRIEKGILRLDDVLKAGNYQKMVKERVTDPDGFKKEFQTLEYWFTRFLAMEGSGLAKKYKGLINSSKNSFCKNFKPDTVIKLTDINKKFLDDWQEYMRTPELQKNGKPKTFVTIKGYARGLKKILEYAAEHNNLYRKEDIPIGKGSKMYQVPTAIKNEAKIPRYLDSEDLEKFKNYIPENEKEELAKDVWFLSYYLGGINCIDLVNLRKDNIQKEHDLLVYYRNKNTKKPSITPSKVPLRKEAYELIEKYKPDTYIMNETKQGYIIDKRPDVSGIPLSPYLLNFHQNSYNMDNTSENLKALVNNGKEYLPAIVKKLKLKTSLNYQMARHTLATNLSRNNAPTSMIQGIYGHASIKSTENYLNGFESKEVKKVFDKI